MNREREHQRQRDEEYQRKERQFEHQRKMQEIRENERRARAIKEERKQEAEQSLEFISCLVVRELILFSCFLCGLSAS